ncbi:adenylosuccinate lyase [Streptomyces sp. OF3]|uniref:Adenylosuccinate lyase n=1 Tax=Streptomyces alkaliterrae TaxID=2213162 RepID=A0A7W3WGI2_9ACTN|nr:adenylosuccinate lyase [Streptomyces alkaliterrae]MBB1251888.1 adenylosuccinate lyase [Streptomyces alkaliterrae]
MDEWLRALLRRTAAESRRAAAGTGGAADGGEGSAEHRRLAAAVARGPEGHPELAAVLTESGRPVWAREVAACALADGGDRRAFETLVFLLNYREATRAECAAEALLRLGDPRTGRAAAALATNELRAAYALHPVLLLTRLAGPESVPALVTALRARLRPGAVPYWGLARACARGLGELGDPRARPVLTEAAAFPRLREAATDALRRLPPP